MDNKNFVWAEGERGVWTRATNIGMTREHARAVATLLHADNPGTVFTVSVGAPMTWTPPSQRK